VTTLAWRSARLGVSLSLAYRLEIGVQFVSASVVAFLNWSLWSAIFTGRDTVAGRGALDLTTYVVVAWVVTTLYATRVDQELARRYRDGDISIDLVRPWSLIAHHYFRDLGRAAVVLLVTTIPIAAWTGLLLPLRTPLHPETWAVFALSLFLAHGIAFGISWLTGVLSFRLKYATGLTHLKSTLVAVLSGALIPLDLYPEPLHQIALWLPFQGMSHTPADLFVERIPSDHVMQALGIQALWVVVLLLAGNLAFHRATRRISIQGG